MTSQAASTRAADALAQRWAAALNDCERAMTRSHLASSTVARIRKHVRKFATETGLTPFDVTAADVTGWLDALDCSRAGLYAYRTSLRTFYRWAHRAGRIDRDPTANDGPHPLAYPTNPGWVQPLTDYRRWLRAGGLTSETIRLRSEHLTRLARETGAAEPWTLTDEDLVAWVSGHRWQRETTRGVRASLRSFYGWAHESGRMGANPAEHLPIVRTNPPAARPTTERQLSDALAAANPRAALMVRLAAELGLRRAEVAQIHTRDMYQDDAGDWWLTVFGKGEKIRRLPLTADLASIIGRQPAGWLFPGRDGHLTPRYVGRIVSDLLPEGVTMHALRHRFATRAYAIDRDVLVKSSGVVYG